MSEIFSRRSFLKGSAALAGATALMGLTGCDSSKVTVEARGAVLTEDSNFTETDSSYNPDLSGPGPSTSNPTPSTPNFHSIGGGIELANMIGVLCTKPRGYENKYPGITLFLQNTSDQSFVINASQFTDVRFNGKIVAVKGLKLGKNSAGQIIFEQAVPLPAKSASGNGTAVVKLYLDAPAQDLKLSGQPVSFAFALPGTKKVRVSGQYKDKATFTITY